MNLAIISGNITRDPELRYTATGTGVAEINVAVNEKWKDKNTGELKEEVSFIGVKVFGKQAETIAQYFKKGSPIMVQGKLKQESWEEKDTGKKRSKTVLVMERFEFMERGGGKSEPRQSAPSSTPAASPVEEDDVPF